MIKLLGRVSSFIDMRKSLHLITIVATVFFIVSCGNNDPLPLSYTNIDVKEIRTGNKLSVKISGIALASDLAVRRIDTLQTNKVLIVRVYLTHAWNGLSNSIDYTVEIPPGIDRLAFGDAAHSIWHRNDD